MEQVSEELTTGGMSDLEYLLISAIIQHAYPDVEDWTDIQGMDSDTVAKFFDAAQDVISVLNMHLPIFKRNSGEIEKALKHYQMMFNNYILQVTHLASQFVKFNESPIL